VAFRDGGQTNQAADGTDVKDEPILLFTEYRHDRAYNVHNPENVDLEVTLYASFCSKAQPESDLEFKSTLFLITSLFDCAANRSLAVFQCLFDR
jgi:hypothetical protein